MQVVKRSGEREQYDRSKTMAAIMRSGASREEAEEILKKVEPRFYNGISTEEIYRQINVLLDVDRRARFSIKKAILDLGPEGHSFETFVGHLFRAMGYDVTIRQVLQGRCVQHEVDQVMHRDGHMEMAECKFHNSLGIKCSIQTALYVYGRFMDLKETMPMEKVWLVTNTRFSSDVVQYGNCVGMGLLGWKYPEEAGLELLIEKHGLYPITVLDMRRNDRRALLDHDLVLVKDLLERGDELRSLVLRSDVDKLLQNASMLVRSR